ncbi:MAG: hypothetical protein WCE48_03590 [Steroidobacteraceae bacterium]
MPPPLVALLSALHAPHARRMLDLTADGARHWHRSVARTGGKPQWA